MLCVPRSWAASPWVIERMTVILSAIWAVFGRVSLKTPPRSSCLDRCPSSPRYSIGANGLGSNVSWWAMPPGRKMWITESALGTIGPSNSSGRPAPSCGRSRRASQAEAGRRPTVMNPRRLNMPRPSHAVPFINAHLRSQGNAGATPGCGPGAAGRTVGQVREIPQAGRVRSPCGGARRPSRAGGEVGRAIRLRDARAISLRGRFGKEVAMSATSRTSPDGRDCCVYC